MERSLSEKFEELPSFEDDETIESIDAMADDFIQKFKAQLKEQRIESLLRYRKPHEAQPALLSHQEIGETSRHDVQISHTDSNDISSQHGSEECAISIAPEQNPVPTPESNIHRQHRYDNERSVHSVPKKFTNIICCVIFNKWLYRVVNVILEISQVTFTEVNERQKISDFLCYKLIFIMSSICLLISLGEFIIEAKRSRVVWQKRGICCWFYYPGINGQLFGSLPLNFSVISSTTQFCVNLAILLSMRKFFKADYLALLFAIVALISPMNHHQEETEEFNHAV